MAKIVITGSGNKEELGSMTLQSEISIDRNDQEKQDTLGTRDHIEGRALGELLASFSDVNYEIHPDDVIAFLVDKKAGTGKEISGIFTLYPNITIDLVTLNLGQMDRSLNYLAGEE